MFKLDQFLNRMCFLIVFQNLFLTSHERLFILVYYWAFLYIFCNGQVLRFGIWRLFHKLNRDILGSNALIQHEILCLIYVSAYLHKCCSNIIHPSFHKNSWFCQLPQDSLQQLYIYWFCKWILRCFKRTRSFCEKKISCISF